jgi:hypothetical protein
MLAATLKPIRLECYLLRLSGTNKVSLFRADSLARYLLQCAWDSSVVSMDKTVVCLNVATRSCNVYPDKCWFAVLCRFWLQCNRTLRRAMTDFNLSENKPLGTWTYRVAQSSHYTPRLRRFHNFQVICGSPCI